MVARRECVWVNVCVLVLDFVYKSKPEIAIALCTSRQVTMALRLSASVKMCGVSILSAAGHGCAKQIEQLDICFQHVRRLTVYEVR